jgi:1,4-dihydroxy-2-naphthoyl-CoA hydrolase
MEPDPNLTATAHELMPYTKLIGLEVLAASAEEVRARLAWAEERCTSNGIMHGGALMSMADAVGAMVAVANLPEGASGTSTISSATNFLRALRAGYAHSVSRPLHRGRTTIVVDTELRDDEGRLLGRVTQTQAVLS